MTKKEKLIIEALGKDKQMGFRMLLKEYQEPTYWHIRRMVVSHDDAQDALQETFVRFFRSYDNYRGDCSLRSWIYRIATNEALRIIGKRRQTILSIDSETTGVDLLMADEHFDDADEIATKLQRAILTLPPKQQIAFNLRYYDELSFDEIAKVADSTAASIKACYHIAKEKITNYMNSND